MDCVTYKYEIEVLSPLCVSSGNKLQSFEVAREREKVYVLDVMKMAKDKNIMKHVIDFNFSEGNNLASFLDKRKINYKKFVKYELEAAGTAWDNNRFEINELIKTAGRPYIPGSSIKGAMRTSLTRKLDEEDVYLNALENAVRNRIADKNCDNQAEESLFGTPYTSPFRFLRVSDTDPADFRDLELTSIKVLNDVRGRIKWFRRGDNEERLEDGLTLYAEAFKVGTRLKGKIGLGFVEYFKNNPLAQNEIKNLPVIDSFVTRINEDMKRYINEELAFYKKYNSPNLSEVVSFYEGLSRMKLEDNQFLLQIGFASGYKAKSVIVKRLNRDFYEKLQNISRGRVYDYLFPKTRRLAVKNGEILYPLGWVKITLR